MKSRWLPRCLRCNRPFGKKVIRSKSSSNVCVDCKREYHREYQRKYNKNKRNEAHRSVHLLKVRLGNQSGPEDWPGDARDIFDDERRVRATLYHQDLIAGRSIRYIPREVRLVKD